MEFHISLFIISIETKSYHHVKFNVPIMLTLKKLINITSIKFFMDIKYGLMV